MPEQPTTCGTCKYWMDYCQQFDDPEEPRDWGECRLRGDHFTEPHKHTEGACEHFEEIGEAHFIGCHEPRTEYVQFRREMQTRLINAMLTPAATKAVWDATVNQV